MCGGTHARRSASPRSACAAVFEDAIVALSVHQRVFADGPDPPARVVVVHAPPPPPGTPPRPSRTSTWATPARTGSATGSSTGAPPPPDSPSPRGSVRLRAPVREGFKLRLDRARELEYPSSTPLTAGCSNASSSSRASTGRAWRRGRDALFSWSSAGKPSKSMDRAAPSGGRDGAVLRISSAGAGVGSATGPRSPPQDPAHASVRLLPPRECSPRLAVGLRIGLRFVGLLFGGVLGGFSPPRLFFGGSTRSSPPGRASPSSTIAPALGAGASPALALPPRLVGRLPSSRCSRPCCAPTSRSLRSTDGPALQFRRSAFSLTESSLDHERRRPEPARRSSTRRGTAPARPGTGLDDAGGGGGRGRVSARVGAMEARSWVRGRAGIAGGAGGARARAARVASRARPFTVIHDLRANDAYWTGKRAGARPARRRGGTRARDAPRWYFLLSDSMQYTAARNGPRRR